MRPGALPVRFTPGAPEAECGRGQYGGVGVRECGECATDRRALEVEGISPHSLPRAQTPTGSGRQRVVTSVSGDEAREGEGEEDGPERHAGGLAPVPGGGAGGVEDADGPAGQGRQPLGGLGPGSRAAGSDSRGSSLTATTRSTRLPCITR